MWFTSRRYQAVFSYSLNSRKYFCFNGISIIYKMIAAINLTDSSGNQNKSQTKFLASCWRCAGEKGLGGEGEGQTPSQ